MKLTKNVKAMAVASALVAPSFVVSTASAEVSFNAQVASMYLFRGQSASAGGAAVSGGVDYENKSGAYAGAWTSSGESTLGNEMDLFVGYKGEAGGVSYDISFWNLDYPAVADSDVNETALELGYDKFTFGLVSGEDGYLYTSVAAEFDKVTLTYGMKTDDADADYSHVDVAYAATDDVTLTASFPSDDGAGATEEPLYVVSYEIPLGKK